MNMRFTRLCGRRLSLPLHLVVLACGILGWAEPAKAFCDPKCLVSPHEIVVRPGDPIEFRAAAYAGFICFHDTKIAMIARPPFMQPGGHRIGKSTFIGDVAVLRVSQIAGEGRPGTYWIKFEARDLESGKTDLCARKITLLPPICKEPPVCEVLEAGPLQATVGGDPVDITVCASAGCDGKHAHIVGDDLPGFVGLLGQFTDEDGRCCVTYRLYPSEGDVGTHTLNFEAFNDGGEGPPGACSVEVEVLTAE